MLAVAYSAEIDDEFVLYSDRILLPGYKMQKRNGPQISALANADLFTQPAALMDFQSQCDQARMKTPLPGKTGEVFRFLGRHSCASYGTCIPRPASTTRTKSRLFNNFGPFPGDVRNSEFVLVGLCPLIRD